MFPWNSTWAPTIYWPLSGAVRQTIAPDTDWFFGRIAPGGGDENIEQRVFEEVASYGKQLGLISEILIELADQVELSDKNAKSLTRLKEIVNRVEEIKVHHHKLQHERLKDELLALRKSGDVRFKELLDAVKSE